MAWIEITEADVLTVLSGPELAGYRSAAKASGQADPLAPITAQVVDLVRGYVGAYKSHTLGAAGLIPQKLLAPALDLIAVRVPQRVGQTPKPGRKDAAEAAVKLLEAVAKGNFDIEEPVTPTDETSSSNHGSPAFAGRDRNFNRTAQDGI